MQAGWSSFTQSTSLYLQQVYHYQTLEIGFYYAMVGVGIISASAWLPKLLSVISNYVAYQTMALIFVITIILSVIIQNNILQWVAGFILASTLLVCYSIMLTIISSKVSDLEQGKAMGGVSAGYGLAWMFSALLMSVTNAYSISYSLILGGVLYLLTVIAMFFANASEKLQCNN